MERFKTLLLVGLFLSSVILSGFVFVDVQEVQHIFKTSQSDYDSINVNISDFFTPQSFQVSLGGGLYTVLYNSEQVGPLWYEYSKLLSNYLQDSKAEVREISIEKRNAIGMRESAKVKLPFMMDLQQLQLLLGMDISIVSNISFDEIIIMGENDYPVFFINSESKMSYQLVSKMSNHDNFRAILSDIYNNPDMIEYKRVEDLFNLRASLDKVDDNTFVENAVLFADSQLPIYDTIELEINQSPVEISQSKTLELIRQDVFGEQINFVKTVRDNLGSVIYVYGYNERALMISPEGHITYQTHISDDIEKQSTDFQSILTKAGQILSKYELLDTEFYLSDYHVDKVDNSVNQSLKFDYKIYGLEVITDKEDKKSAVEIDFVNGNLSRFAINYRKTLRNNESMIFTESGMLFDILNASDALVSMQEKYMSDNNIILDPDNKDDASISNQIPFETLQGITDIRLVYYPQYTDLGITLNPAWQFTAGGKSYYLNFYQGLNVNQ